MTISEIPQKLDYVAEVTSDHKANVTEFLRKAFVDGDSSLLVFQHDSLAAGNKASEAATEAAGGKAKDGAEKGKVRCPLVV